VRVDSQFDHRVDRGGTIINQGRHQQKKAAPDSYVLQDLMYPVGIIMASVAFLAPAIHRTFCILDVTLTQRPLRFDTIVVDLDLDLAQPVIQAGPSTLTRLSKPDPR